MDFRTEIQYTVLWLFCMTIVGAFAVYMDMRNVLPVLGFVAITPVSCLAVRALDRLTTPAPKRDV